MGLFKKEPVGEMTDPVRGSAEIVGITGGVQESTDPRMGEARWARGTMKLIVTADGVRATEVDWEGQVMCAHLPWEGQTIPVTVDRANPHMISIPWKELPSAKEALRLQRERIDEEVDESLEEAGKIVQQGQDDLEDARQTWREMLERGEITQSQFEKEMRDLDET